MRIMKEGKSGLETQKPSWMCDSINTQKSGPLHSTYNLVSRHSFVFSLSRSSLEYRMRQSWNVIYKYLFRQRFLYIWKRKAIHYWNLNWTLNETGELYLYHLIVGGYGRNIQGGHVVCDVTAASTTLLGGKPAMATFLQFCEVEARR